MDVVMDIVNAAIVETARWAVILMGALLVLLVIWGLCYRLALLTIGRRIAVTGSFYWGGVDYRVIPEVEAALIYNQLRESQAEDPL